MEIERVESTPKKKPSRQPWHAVSIGTALECCGAADAAKGRRYLSNEAPRLPLVECGQPWTCRCVYRHHADRRATPRRASDRSGLRSPRPYDEKRAVYPRRTGDV